MEGHFESFYIRNSLCKVTVKRIFLSYVTVAVCAVALGFTMVFTGITGQVAHHLSSSSTATTVGDTPNENDLHGSPAIPSAEAITLPFPITAYTTASYALDGDAAAGPQIATIIEEFHGRDCEFCIKIVYNPHLEGKAGFAMVTDRPLAVENPQRLFLSARGEHGGEQIRFFLLGKETDTTGTSSDELFDNVEFAGKSETLTLTTQKRMYQVEVPQVSPEKLEDLTYLLAIEVDAGSGVRPVIIYLGGLLYQEIEPHPDFIVKQDTSVTES